jgi:pimeloyl-ACP methyl ester carboxylesterase
VSPIEASEEGRSRITGWTPGSEFHLLHENALEIGLPAVSIPPARRERVALGLGRSSSAVVFGTAEPELVFLHGGGQNAHTWDSTVLALGRPAIAIDLPGHGHALPRSIASPVAIADDVAVTVELLAPRARAVVGMSLGGLAAIALCRTAPSLVRALVVVDVTPATDRARTSAVVDFITGPASFESFDEMLQRTVVFHPERSRSSLRRGLLHNAVQGEDGRWTWRYRREGDESLLGKGEVDFTPLWEILGSLRIPVLFVRGMLPGSAVRDEDEIELCRRVPHASVLRVLDAGHSVQGDRPVVLAQAIRSFLSELSNVVHFDSGR